MATSSAGPVPTAEELARAVEEAYAHMSAYVFTMHVLQGATLAEMHVTPEREVLRVAVQMGPGTVRADVFKPGAAQPWLTYVDDGGQMWEEAEGRRLVHPDHPPHGKRNLLLAPEIGLDGCLFGNVLSSWLGGEDGSHVSYMLRRIQAGTIVQAEDRGRSCWLSESDTGCGGPGGIRSNHRLWFDQQTHLLVRREVTQTAYTDSGNVLQVIKRTGVFDSSAAAEPPCGSP